MVGSGNPCLLTGIEITSWKMCVQHDSVQVEKEESRFTPYRISFADVRYHRDEMSLAAETKTMVLGISMNPLTSQHVSWIMLQWVYKSRLKKQTQKQFAHLHNQHRKKVCFPKQLGDFLTLVWDIFHRDKSGQFTREKASMRQTSDS